ncbi:IS66 family insertion sequence element accessory protein TnpB [Bradyrhizobium sp. sGM-13]|uniref:IS66 family insertion sequence element accessory protein TnpB n=1 Tax=Bradyrhizobium sp. sGM-13 TaxID=2831781 RepID=UPI001BD0B732|nr:IS66 family insertion sequence element accessory protein TnpB [Bradyrhizobium sp. sGM-13]
MIPAGVQVYLVSTPVDFRKGPTGLIALVRDRGADPFSGELFVFRSKRADRIKAVWRDGSGVCLFAKTLEETKFCWQKIAPTRVRLNHAQLLALIDGLDWTKVRPVGVKRPESVA